jgi:hypothetical protein
MDGAPGSGEDESGEGRVKRARGVSGRRGTGALMDEQSKLSGAEGPNEETRHEPRAGNKGKKDTGMDRVDC